MTHINGAQHRPTTGKVLTSAAVGLGVGTVAGGFVGSVWRTNGAVVHQARNMGLGFGLTAVGVTGLMTAGALTSESANEKVIAAGAIGGAVIGAIKGGIEFSGKGERLMIPLGVVLCGGLGLLGGAFAGYGASGLMNLGR